MNGRIAQKIFLHPILVDIKEQWLKVHKSVIQIEDQLAKDILPKPTREMCELLIAGEDHRFNIHFGVDPIAIFRAFWKTLFFNEIQGASTIAMQLVRTITGQYERTIHRKIVEMILAILLTYYVKKERLPILYLSVAYYGWNMNNFREACINLNLSIDSLTESQAANIVARLKYPEPSVICKRRIQKIENRAKYLIRLRQRQKFHIQYCNGAIQNTKPISKCY